MQPQSHLRMMGVGAGRYLFFFTHARARTPRPYASAGPVFFLHRTWRLWSSISVIVPGADTENVLMRKFWPSLVAQAT